MLSGHKTHSLAYEFKVQGADLEEESKYTLEMTMGYLQTDRVQVELDLIEKAITGEDPSSGASDTMNQADTGGLQRKEQDFIAVLIKHDFFVGEIEEETDLFLTIVAIAMSLVIIVISCYSCYYGLIKPQYKKLKVRFAKSQ